MKKFFTSNKKRTPEELEKQKLEAQKIRTMYPDRIPVIVSKSINSKMPEMKHKKFLVPADTTVGEFIYIIRKRLILRPDQAIFLFLSKTETLAPTGQMMSQVYDEHKDECGFLFMTYCEESTFGS